MKKIVGQILAGIVAIFLAVKFVPGVVLKIIAGQSSFFTANWQIIVLFGFVLGLLNAFLKPILNIITFPLKFLTLGLFSFALNMFLIWLADKIFPEVNIEGLIPLFWTALIFWLVSIIFEWFREKNK